jgi:hypothetical protein
MRFARLLGGLTLVLVVAATASAQTAIYTVKQPQAEARSGPSDAPLHYVTNRLLQGDKVEVIREEPSGWLAIKPPVGSFSWVNTRLLRQLSKNVWIVESEAPVEVLYGSTFREEKPTVISSRLTRGTQIESIGQPWTPPDGGIWVRIKPPPSEVRYVRAADVRPDAAPGGPAPPATVAGTQSSASEGQNWNRPVPLVPPPAVDRPAAVLQSPANPRWQEAERAEREGRVNEAIELYTQLGQTVANSDHELAMRCYNQANALRRGRTYTTETRLRPVAAGTVSQNAAGYAQQNCCTPCGQNGYIFRGRLRPAYQSLDYLRTYALENQKGEIIAYVTPAGVNLEPHVNRVVEVSGVACWRGDVRNNYVRASQVTPLQ